jgi:molecular chaperone GrpE (heat shock protein)
MRICKLEQDIKDEVLNSNYWTHSRLLQLAKIPNYDVRMKKFDEFKNRIEKKSKKNEGETDDVDVTQTENTENNDDQNSVDNETVNETTNQKILRFQAHVNTFKSKLEKIKKYNFDSESIEKLKPDLTQILNMINEILN